MVHDAHATTNLTTSANLGTSRYRSMRGDYSIPADRYVVPDLNQVIQFYTITDYGIFDCTPIDSCIGTDFYIVSDHHPAKLRDTDPMLTVSRQAETVSSNNYPGRQPAILSDLGTLLQDNILTNDCTRSDVRIPTNLYSGTDYDILAEDGTVLYNAIGTYRNVIGYPFFRFDNSCRVY